MDPAVRKVIFPANIDIRDTVDYKKVMKDYQLGPNGAIMTCLNLCCTKLQEVSSFHFERVFIVSDASNC